MCIYIYVYIGLKEVNIYITLISVMYIYNIYIGLTEVTIYITLISVMYIYIYIGLKEYIGIHVNNKLR
jgi:hypothetical protein